jgi:hypothetical protein
MIMSAKVFEDFAFFCQHQLVSKDVDPVYPLLRLLVSPLLEEQALWHTLLYVGYYSLPSSRAAFDRVPSVDALPLSLSRLPTGVERRGFRGGTITRHVDSLLYLHETFGSLKAWLCQEFGRDIRQNWIHLQNTLQQAWGNGRWAAYKTGEILQKVHDFPVQPTDMGHEFSTGPRHGLALFYGNAWGNAPDAIQTLNAQGENLLQCLAEQGIHMGIEQLETMLCDFYSLVGGRYYVGHDIDMLQTQLLASSLSSDILEPIWQARKRALPHAYLGEIQGWTGIDRERKKVYQRTGRVIIRG